MAHPGFGHLWQQGEMSDVEIVIGVHGELHLTAASAEAPEGQSSTNTVLQQFPGHSTILSLRPFFVAQALRWSSQTQPGSSSMPSCPSDTTSSTQRARKQVNITLPDASYEPAAMAVLAGLYQVQPWHKLLADLTPQQQVMAAVLADMWQLPAAFEAAVGVLQDATNSGDRLSAVLEQLLSMEAVPNCLLSVIDYSWQELLSKYSDAAAVPSSVLPVFEHVLLSKYGDLEAVWAPDLLGASLQASLMALPLYAVEVLLASDKLKVGSEDTVLYTVQAYADNLGRTSLSGLQAKAAVLEACLKLAPLVRCPHLSQFWLSASVLSDHADKLLLHELQPQLKRLLLLKPACREDSSLFAKKLQDTVPGVPASWLLPVRAITPVTSATLEWELDVEAIRQAAQDSASFKQTTFRRSPTSCLLGGVIWGIGLQCNWDASNAGSTVGVYVQCRSLPAGAFCHCTFSLGCAADRCFNNPPSDTMSGGTCKGCGWDDFFRLGAMAGGFDEVSWAAKGLPATGSIFLVLTVQNMGM